MTLWGYWGVCPGSAVKDLSPTMEHSIPSARILSGEGWRIVGVPTSRSIHTLAKRGRAVGFADGWIVFRRDGEKTPEGLDVDALMAPQAELPWGRYVAAAVTESGRRLSLGVDPLGIANLFFAPNPSGSGYIFAAELERLIQLMGAAPSLNYDAVATYIQHDQVGYDTHALPFVGVRRIGTGAVIRIDASGWRTEQIWHPPRPGDASEPVDPEELRDCLVSCTSTWIGDRAGLAVQLSGGIDSSTVAWAASQSGRSVSAQFFDHGAHSARAEERGYAERVARHLAIELTATLGDLLPPFAPSRGSTRRWELPGLIALLDRQFEVVTRHAGTDLVLLGEGGDQVFHVWDQPDYAHDLILRGQVGSALRTLRDFSYWYGTPFLQLARTYLGYERSRWRGASAVAARALGINSLPAPSWLLVEPDLRRWLLETWAVSDRRRGMGAGRVDHVRNIVGTTVNQAQLLSHDPGRFAYPLLSLPLVELVLRAPISQLFRLDRDRPLLRDAMSGLLPQAVVDRPTKGEYSQMWVDGLRGNAARVRELIHDGRLAQCGLIDRVGALRALSTATGGSAAELPLLLRLISMETWCRQWL